MTVTISRLYELLCRRSKGRDELGGGGRPAIGHEHRR